MPNDFQDLAAAQRETTKALQTLTARLRRNPPIRDREDGLRSLTASAGRSGAAVKTSRTGGEQRTTQALRGLGVASSAAVGVEQSLNRTVRAVQDLGSGLTANTRVLEKSSLAFTSSLKGLLSGLGGGLRGRGGLGGFLKSGFGLAGLGLKIAGLFSRKKASPVFSTFELPPSLSFEVANTDNMLAGFPRIARGQAGTVREIQPEVASTPQPQVVVNVSAMDAQSFMDRSNDIARAVRDAMLHMHPVNDLISEV